MLCQTFKIHYAVSLIIFCWFTVLQTECVIQYSKYTFKFPESNLVGYCWKPWQKITSFWGASHISYYRNQCVKFSGVGCKIPEWSKLPLEKYTVEKWKCWEYTNNNVSDNMFFVIMLTCPCTLDHREPNDIVKLGFSGVYIISLLHFIYF